MSLPVVGELRPWADPTLLQINRLPMHVPLTGTRRRSLDGVWQLELFDNPDAIPATALCGHRPRSAAVHVPGNWTMQELGPGQHDAPHYTNVRMPFPGPPPLLPSRNPAGVYRRSFELPTAWFKARTTLHIDGADGIHIVYVNGRFSGYGTDSRLPSEYDVSEHVAAGVNELAVVVVRYSAHSYVEDQDQWWMAGLHRSVWLESRRAVCIADVVVSGDFDPRTGGGTAEVVTTVDFSRAPVAGWSLRATLHDPSGRVTGGPQQAEVPHQHNRPYAFTGHQTALRWEVGPARPWSAETPDLYSVTVELIDPRGRTQQAETQRLGLRRVEVRDRQLLVNGQPVWIFGVNRHDHHPDRGKAVTRDDMLADLRMMRAHNITAVRTSHYPNDSAFYDLCDELGMYVVGEANIESHAYNTSLCDDPTYRATWLDRGARHGAARSQPPLDHHVEPRQREWLRRQPRRCLPVGSVPPTAAARCITRALYSTPAGSMVAGPQLTSSARCIRRSTRFATTANPAAVAVP